MGHYSFQYLTFSGGRPDTPVGQETGLSYGHGSIKPFSIAESMGPGADASADHIIVESPYINPSAAQALALGTPNVRLEKGFTIPGSDQTGGFWARAWRLPPSIRMSAKEASQLESKLGRN